MCSKWWGCVVRGVWGVGGEGWVNGESVVSVFLNREGVSFGV